MLPSDLPGFATPSRPAISPDGNAVLFTVSRMNLEDDRYDNTVWLWDRSHGARQFTAGPGDTTPVWSPDGTKAAFVRTVDQVAQAAVISIDGGEATVLTDSPKGVRTIKWMPDGESLLVHSVDWADEWADLDTDGRARQPRRITELPYRFDTLGWIHTDAHRLSIVPLDGSEPTTLAADLPSISSVGLTADGEHVLFLSDLRDVALRDLRRAVYTLPTSGGEITEVAPIGHWMAVASAADDTIFATGFPDGVDTWPRSQTLWRRDGDDWVEVSPELDRSLVLVFGTPITPQPVEGGVVSAIEDAGKVGLIHTAPDGTVARLIDEELALTGFSSTPDGATVAFTASRMDAPGDLHLWTADGVETLTDLNPDVADALSLVEGRHLQVEGEGGPIDAWIFMPPGEEKVPLLLNIHGGPASQYGWGFFDEFQVYARAGYGVVACNPRGSSGRGTKWMKDVVGDGWGTNDLSDVRAVIDAALENEPRLDSDRLGVMGGSYGGFLTGWIIGHEDRWKSAIVERGLLSYTSFVGTSDIGHTFPMYYVETDLPDGLQLLWDKSPQAHAHKVVTPTLLVHSENDFRCPIEQAEQYFMQLLKNGTPTEMIRFPGESHELSRSGKPKHRQERFDAILEWHERFLK